MLSLLRLLTRQKKVPHEKTPHFNRCLTTWDLVSLSIGATLGAGIYVVTGQVAGSVAGPAVILSFTIAAIASVLSGLCYAEFGARVPHTTGSAYTYSYVTVGEFSAFVIGWNLILEYMIGTAADARALSGCFDYVIGNAIRNFTLAHIGKFHIPTLGDTYLDFLSCVLTLVVTVVLASGVKQSSIFSTICNVVNLAVVGFIIIAGAFYVRRENWSKKSGFFPYGVSGVLGGAATCFYAFIGFDIIATTGQETKNPHRSIPLAIMISLFIVFMCYFSVSSIITLIVPYYTLDKLSPIPNAFAQRGFRIATYIVGIGAVCGLFSSLMGSLFPLPRIIYAMAKDGLLFEAFKKVSHKSEIPFVATIYPGMLTALLALIFNLDELVEMMSIGTLLAYTLVSLCVLILRYQPSGDLSSYTSFEFGKLVLNDGENVKDPETIFPNDSDKMEDNTDYMDERDRDKLVVKDKKSCNLAVLEQRRGLDQRRPPYSSSIPTAKTGRIVCWASMLLCASVLAFFVLITHGVEEILQKDYFVIALVIFIGFICIACICVIALMPQNCVKLSFSVPCVPGVPITAIFFNIFLMSKLSRITWLRFAIWMILGRKFIILMSSHFLSV